MATMLHFSLATLLVLPLGLCFFHPRNFISRLDTSSPMVKNAPHNTRFQDHTQSKQGPWHSSYSTTSAYRPMIPGNKPPLPLWNRPRHPQFKANWPMVGPPPAGVMEVLPKAISKVMSTYGRPPSAASSTAKPPVIWFPNQNEECEQDSGGGGFSTFSLLALVMSVTNLVGILASNANNNINNNNNDNNINNNNVQDANENNANNNGNVFTMVTFGGGRRRKRSLEATFPAETGKRGKSPATVDSEANWNDVFGRRNNDSIGDYCWLDDYDEVIAEEVAAVVSLTFLRTHVQAALTDDLGCLCRSLCSANADAVEWGDVAHALAEALSEAHVEWMSKKVPWLNTITLQEAASVGCSNKGSQRSCHNRYHCPEETQAFLDDDKSVMKTLVRLRVQNGVRL